MGMLSFKVIIEPQEEGGYVVYAPNLPGCFSQGETREEARANIKEAIKLYLDTLKAEKVPLPQVEVCEVTV